MGRGTACDARESALEPEAHQGTLFAEIEAAFGQSSEPLRALASTGVEAAGVVGKKRLPTTRGPGAIGGSQTATCWVSDHHREAGFDVLRPGRMYPHPGITTLFSVLRI